jgi:branched-chain amino acid transport system ATP-binding protein
MALLEVNNLVKDFGGLRANDGISFQLEPGELLGLIGPNGAGKTTLFNCIAGKHPVTSGQIVFDGEDITALKAPRWPAAAWPAPSRSMPPAAI